MGRLPGRVEWADAALAPMGQRASRHRSNRSQAAVPKRAPRMSTATSIGEDSRPGIRDWIASSSSASAAVPITSRHAVYEREWTKVALRRAMRDRLPEGVLRRRDKMGFATPAMGWLRHSLSEVSRTLRNAQVVRIRMLRRSHRERLSGPGVSAWSR